MDGTVQILLILAVVIVVVAAFVLTQKKKSGGGSGNMVGKASPKAEFYSFSAFPTEKGSMGSPSGFALFLFRDGAWTLQEDFSKPGFVAVAPKTPGSFEGQVLRRESGIPSQS